MVVLNKIYTKTGDAGETALGNGDRVAKYDQRVSAYGTVDDAIGYVERLVEAGADEIMFLVQMGSVPQKAALRTIELLGSEVIPRFR